MDIIEQYNPAVVVPVYGALVLPGVTGVTLELKEAGETLLRALHTESRVLLLPRRTAEGEPSPEDFHRFGVLFAAEDTQPVKEGWQVRGRTLERVAAETPELNDGLYRARYTPAPELNDLEPKDEADLLEHLNRQVREISAHFRGGEKYAEAAAAQRSVNALISYVGRYMPVSAEEKYELLKIDSLKERSLRFLDLLLKQKSSVELNMEISEKLSDKASQTYRRQLLREQMKAIQAELDEDADADTDGPEEEDGEQPAGYKARIERASLPDDVRKAALAEARKLDTMGQGNPEESVVRNYLDFLLSLPWADTEAAPVDLAAARKLLNEQHYGLDKVKERILQHLAVRQLRRDNKGSILLLVGPPGTGKTSLGKSIAEAMGRRYVRISLGGIRDESEIRGHRRTYIGALPGRILQSLKTAGSKNPVMVLDEVDKLLTGGYSGDPASALLEVLDPEQNSTFTDHYLDLPFDLSQVFFIATANTMDSIPAPLLDRMEVLEVTGYTADEKFHIAKEHLLPQVLADHGLTEAQLTIPDEVLRTIIEEYTLESGVRGLKKQLAALARAASEKIVSGEADGGFAVQTDRLEELLGRRVSRHECAGADNPPGVVTGLAWTPVGGEILFIEATDMPGTGEVTLTGQLGDVMKESARISLSLLKSRLPLNTVNFKERDVHIHVPSGSVPKDGPSAGIALFTALASLFLDKKVDPRLAMTGEITLRGAVLPIGGLKEKLLGAQRAGIKRVLIPRENEIDLRDVPGEVLAELDITPVDTVEDVLRETLDVALPRMDHLYGMGSGHAIGA